MNAVFVPPPPAEVDRLMSELETFIHAPDRMSPLIKAALIRSVRVVLPGTHFNKILILQNLVTRGCLQISLL